MKCPAIRTGSGVPLPYESPMRDRAEEWFKKSNIS